MTGVVFKKLLFVKKQKGAGESTSSRLHVETSTTVTWRCPSLVGHPGPPPATGAGSKDAERALCPRAGSNGPAGTPRLSPEPAAFGSPAFLQTHFCVVVTAPRIRG